MMPDYERYKKMIWDLAWKQVKANPNLELLELVAEANIAFCEAALTWDPAKACFSTHLWWKIKGRFSQANSRRVEWDMNTTTIEEANEVEDISNPMATCALKCAVEDLGDEAKEVILIVFNSAGEFCDFTSSTVSVNVTNIRRYLSSLHWNFKKIEETVKEIRTMVKNL